MTSQTKELKNLLHESIENIDDEELLRIAKNILDRRYKPANKIELTEYQKQRIKQAKQSISEGNTLSNKRADELVDRWLNE